MTEPNKQQYWFPAKSYGWGWGKPTSWQGWAVLLVFAALLAAGYFLFPPERDGVAYFLYTAALGAGLVAVCWLKGEPTRWRWGGK